MARWEDAWWESTLGSGVRRKDQRSGAYRSYVPDLLAPIFRLPIVSRCDALRISIWGGFLQLGTTIGPVVARAGRDFHISG